MPNNQQQPEIISTMISYKESSTWFTLTEPMLQNQFHPLLTCTVQASLHIVVFSPSVLDLHLTSPQASFPEILDKTVEYVNMWSVYWQNGIPCFHVLHLFPKKMGGVMSTYTNLLPLRTRILKIRNAAGKHLHESRTPFVVLNIL